MNASDFVIALIAGFHGRIQGRTLLQKRAYFVSELCGLSDNLDYDAHYYGPYSSVIDNTVARLKSLGFLTEENTGFGTTSAGFEVKRYDYFLTSDGGKILESIPAEFKTNIEAACQTIINAGDPNYFVLSIAAKAHFILRKRGGAMTRQEIIREAEKFDWDIQNDSLNGAIDFLEKLGLVRTGTPATN